MVKRGQSSGHGESRTLFAPSPPPPPKREHMLGGGGGGLGRGAGGREQGPRELLQRTKAPEE